MRRANKKTDKEGFVEGREEQLDVNEGEDIKGALGTIDDDNDDQMDVDYDPTVDDPSSKANRKGQK